MIATKRVYTLIVLILSCFSTAAQNAPVGKWDVHLPYASALGVATDGHTLFTICNQAFFTLDINNGEQTVSYSKLDGMADIGMSAIGYDNTTSTAVLIYRNGNIDLFKNNTFYNIPDLKNKVISTIKKVYEVYCDNGFAYLSTSTGIIVIDLANRYITKTIALTLNTPSKSSVVLKVTSFIRSDNYFYAATENGVYKTDISNPRILNLNEWVRTDSTNGILQIRSVNNKLYFASARAVHTLVHDTLAPVYTASTVLRTAIKRIDAGNNLLFIREYSDSTKFAGVKMMDTNGTFTDSLAGIGNPVQAIELPDNSIWIADSLMGLRKKTGAGQTALFIPEGPSSANSFDIYANNRDVFIAHGEYNQFYGANSTLYGISRYHDNKWKLYKTGVFHPIDYIRDITVLARDESNGTLYAGSFLNGLVVLKPDESLQLIRSVFDGSGTYGPAYQQVIGLDIDKSDNLWVTLVNADHPLYVKTADDTWYKFKLPDIYFGGPVVVDDNGQVYFLSLSLVGTLGGGVAVFNTNGTIGNPNDDATYHIKAGAGYGNLPSNNVICISKDKNNEIWIGTDNGIGIIKDNCKAPFTQTAPCEAVVPVVQNGPVYGPLFAGVAVNTIAVDEANQKWVGTDKGAWLLSPDGGAVICRFTADNSPLPSNNIQKIAVDKQTGDVYIGTDEGLVSFHGTVTEAGTSVENPLIFPNPVPSGYSGSIALRGLPTGSDIRITDIAGQLVYHTRLDNGGQATWDGKDYTGHRPQSGVYLVYIASSDGKQTYTGKIVFIQ